MILCDDLFFRREHYDFGTKSENLRMILSEDLFFLSVNE